MLGKYSTISNTRPVTTHICIYAMGTYFSPWQTSTANVPKPFLRKPAHPVRLNIGTLQNLPSCFQSIKSITSLHCQRPLQKHVNNHIDNVNGVTFVTRKHMSPQWPIFSFDVSNNNYYYYYILFCTNHLLLYARNNPCHFKFCRLTRFWKSYPEREEHTYILQQWPKRWQNNDHFSIFDLLKLLQ